MARKNVRATSSRPGKSKKTNKKDIVKMLVPLMSLVVLIYVLHKIIKLVIIPTDIVMIENGIIFKEEDAIRLCYKR